MFIFVSKDNTMEPIQLYTKLSYLPSDLKEKVNAFIDYLISKQNKELSKNAPKFGCAKDQIYISPDFDEPLADFNDYQ